MDDLPGLLEALASDCDETDGWQDAAPTCRQAAAEIRSLREQAAELEAELGYHGIYPNPIIPRDTKADSDGDGGA